MATPLQSSLEDGEPGLRPLKEVHTPAPWTYVRDGDYWEISPANIGGKDNYEGNEADYRLISAAPDLLKVCKIFLNGDDRFQIFAGGNPIAVDKMLTFARAAVDKAEGPSPEGAAPTQDTEGGK